MTPCESASGGCLCGAVSFVVELPVKWCAHCHCTLCRRAHGAAFVTWFGVDDAGFSFRTGEELVHWFASSAEGRRGFCSRCGSTLFFRSSRWPEEMHVVLAVMEGDIGRRPAAHVYWDRHVAWVELADDLKRLGGETGVEPLEPDGP